MSSSSPSAMALALLLLTSACAARTEITQQSAVDASAASASVLDQVDLFIGTAGDHGQLHPAASVPFGMIQMGPETSGRSHSGYDFNSDQLLGFSHNRSSGVGCRGSGGNLLVRMDYSDVVDGPVRMDKDSEVASPGYYRVRYGADAISAEMTATTSSGWQRYRFPRPGRVWLNVDLSHAHHRFYDGEYSIGQSGTLSGRIRSATVCDEGRYAAYFSLKTSREPQQIVEQSALQVKFRFDVDAGDSLLVQTAFSSVDEESAEAKRLADARLNDFDQVKAAAAEQWQDKLGRFSVRGDEQRRRLFYSHLYRVFLSPFRLAEAGESYRSSDGKRYRADTRPHYFGWSIWDTFRTKFPLLTIVDPAAMTDIAASLAELYQHGKPLWATDSEPYITVRTEHAGIVLLDAWRKGIRSFDADLLLPALATEADGLPRKSPDQVLEAAYDDWAVGTYAQLLGQWDVAERYLVRAGEYRSTWDEKFRVMGANADIMHGDGLYEGTLWQYRWFVLFDTAWIIARMGGAEQFTAELQNFFDRQLFNMGNQPDIQAPFMFNFSGQAWRTQQQVFELLNEPMAHWYGTHEKKPQPFIGQTFRAQAEGFIPEMDDDDGTMTAWYVFAVMGLYPVAPGVPVYTLHAPGLENITLSLDNGKTLRLRNPTPDKPYIESVNLNGKPLERAWITHQEIMRGASLDFVTSDTPNPDWGRGSIYSTSLESPLGTNQ